MRGSRSTLVKRWRQEAAFHDGMVQHDTRWTTFRAYGLSAASIDYAKARVRNIPNKVILDLGCGDGRHTLSFLKSGATVLACDISFGMVKAALTRLARANSNGVFFCQQMAGEEMGFATESIDVIFGISILHHLDIPLAIEEIKRVLKPGGCAIFIEPLIHNPVTRLYRAFTPGRHSELEKPLRYSIFNFLEKHFREVNHREFYLLSLAAAIFAFLYRKDWFDRLLPTMMRLDEALFSRFPELRRYAWITVVELTK